MATKLIYEHTMDQAYFEGSIEYWWFLATGLEQIEVWSIVVKISAQNIEYRL